MGIQPKPPTIKGPADWFTGDVFIDPIVQPDGDSQLNVGAVHFTPGARSAWHSHDGGQSLYVTEGRGLVQARNEDIVELRAVDLLTRHLETTAQHLEAIAPDVNLAS